MSVTLENVRLRGPDAERPLLDGVSLHIGDVSRVGILGTSKPGISMVLRLICGTKTPDEGIIRRNGRVSWPIPLASFLVGHRTIASNVRFITRLYGIDDEGLPRRIAATVELEEFVNTPLAKCPRYAKSRLAFALGVGLDFDTYLFDGSFAPVDKPIKKDAVKLSADRTAGRGIVVATSAPPEVEQNCESVYVLEEGRATYFEEASQGVEHFKQLLAADKKLEKMSVTKREADEDEDEGLGDVDLLGAAVADALD